MIMLPSPLRAIRFKTISLLLFIFLTFFTFGNSYADKVYKVQKNDFLGKIVKRNYSTNSNLSKEQVMVAILRANPEAFRGGNIHFLKRVDQLILPSVETIALISQAEALKTVNKHYEFFKRNKTGNFPPIALKRPTKDATEDKKGENKDQAVADGNNDKEAKSEPSSKTGKPDSSFSTLSELSGDPSEKSTDTTTTTTTAASQNNKNNDKSDNNASSESFSTLSELTDDTAKTPDTNKDSQNTSSDSFSSLSELTDDTSASSETSSLDSFSTLSELQDEAAQTDSSTAINQQLEQKQQEATVKGDQLQDLEKRNEEQSKTLDQLNNKIKTLEDDLASKAQNQPTGAATEKSGSMFVLNKTIVPLLLLLPLLALLGLLWWWKKRKTAAIEPEVEVETVGTNATDVLQNKEKHIFKKIDSYNAKSIEQAAKKQQTPVTSQKDQSTTTDKAEPEVEQDQAEATTIDENANANTEESAIKLDMARAYQEMGYAEEAKEMLEEVIREGTNEQREMAEGLLAVL